MLARYMPLVLDPLAASIVTTMRLSSTITGRADLAGKAVGVWEGYASMLDTTEIRAVPLPWYAMQCWRLHARA